MPPEVTPPGGVELFIESGIDEIDVFLVHLLPCQPQGFAEALKVDDFPLSKKANDVVHIGIIGKTEDVVVGYSSLLLGSQILGQVSDHIPLHRHGSRTVWESGGSGGIDTRGAVHKVGVEACRANLLFTEIAGELVHNSSNHLQMSEVLYTYRGVVMSHPTIAIELL